MFIFCSSPVLSYSNYQSTKVPPRDPPLIILHGLFGSKSNWSSLGKAFAASGRRVRTKVIGFSFTGLFTFYKYPTYYHDDTVWNLVQAFDNN